MSSRGSLPGFGASGFDPLRVMGSPSPPPVARDKLTPFSKGNLSPCPWFPRFSGRWHRAWDALIPPPNLCRKGLGHTCPAPSSGAGLWVLSMEGPSSLQKGRRGFAGTRKCSPAWEGGGRGLQRTEGRPEQVLPADSLNPGTRGLIREGLPEQEPAG